MSDDGGGGGLVAAVCELGFSEAQCLRAIAAGSETPEGIVEW